MIYAVFVNIDLVRHNNSLCIDEHGYCELGAHNKLWFYRLQ